MKSLDDIAEEAANAISGHYHTGGTPIRDTKIIRSAIDRALTLVLTREPSEEMKDLGSRIAEGPGWLGAYRAMQAALLASLTKEKT